MRPQILGVNMSKIINKAMGPLLLTATLTRTVEGTRSSSALTAGTVVGATTTSWTCKGFTDSYKNNEIMGFRHGGAEVDGTLIKTGDRKIVILGGSLPDDIDPTTNDTVTIEGVIWRIIQVTRDPAAATFTCQGRR
jgi:hypothetical protein